MRSADSYTAGKTATPCAHASDAEGARTPGRAIRSDAQFSGQVIADSPKHAADRALGIPLC